MARMTNKYDEEAPAFLVMRKWGSISAFAQALGKAPTTVTRWLESGHILGRFQAEIIAAARRDGKSIEPKDFVDMRLFADSETA